MIGLSGEIPLVSHSDVTSPFPPSGNGGYASNLDVPLSVEVTVGGPPSKKFISIYEPKLSYHSRLGRIIAAYD